MKRGEWSEHPLEPSVLDQFSQQQQLRLKLMQSDVPPETLQLRVVDGAKISDKSWRRMLNETLQTPLGDIEAVHYQAVLKNRKALDKEVFCENDAKCFALSEAIDGAGKHYKIVYGIILGSGVGGGLVIDKKIVSGPNGVAGEWGHNQIHELGQHGRRPGRPGRIDWHLFHGGHAGHRELQLHGALGRQCPCRRRHR